MNRIQVSDRDVRDPDRLRVLLDSAHKRLYALLEEVESIKSDIRGVRGGTLSADDRKLLNQISIGSTSNSAPAQNALIPKVDTLPPIATALDGQMVQLSTDGQVYRFDGATQTWTTFTTGTHNLLSATHPDTVAASPVRGDIIAANATPAWARVPRGTANQGLVIDPTGNDVLWSSQVDLLNLAQTFTQTKTFDALTALTIGGGNTHGAKWDLVLQDEEITLNTAGLTTDSTAFLLPLTSLILGVSARITTTITTATKWRMGDTVTNDRFRSDNTNLTAGIGIWCPNHWNGGVSTDANGPTQLAVDKVRITTDLNPGAGKIRVVTLALVATTPTS